MSVPRTVAEVSVRSIVFDCHILFTALDILIETTKEGWMEYLRRTMLKVKGRTTERSCIGC